MPDEQPPTVVSITIPDEPPSTCDRFVYWWEGEYEGNCELPEGHDGPHYDGMNWFDDNNEAVEPPGDGQPEEAK